MSELCECTECGECERNLASLGLKHGCRTVIVTVAVNTDEDVETVALRMQDAAAADNRSFVKLYAQLSPVSAAKMIWLRHLQYQLEEGCDEDEVV